MIYLSGIDFGDQLDDDVAELIASILLLARCFYMVCLGCCVPCFSVRRRVSYQSQPSVACTAPGGSSTLQGPVGNQRRLLVIIGRFL